ncbi:MAG: hypothetical protein J0I06_23400 [Planctomycetes bacterium]|nr:hypothetical protein [Planctomycetota bacterium]
MTEAAEPDEVAPLWHTRLGALRWHTAEQLWFAEVDRVLVRDGQVGVASPADLEPAATFLDWLGVNGELFRTRAVTAMFDYDLVLDYDLAENELASKLVIHSLTVRNGTTQAWLDTGGATTGYLCPIRLDSQHRIIGMGL